MREFRTISVTDEDLDEVNNMLDWHAGTLLPDGRLLGRLERTPGKRTRPDTVPDERIILLNRRVPLRGRSVLEIGCFEGIHTLGLCQFDNIIHFQRLKLPKRFEVFYYGKPVELILPMDADNKLDMGCVLLTKFGQDLAPICGSQPVEGFFEFVYDKWAVESLIPAAEVELLIQEPSAE